MESKGETATRIVKEALGLLSKAIKPSSTLERNRRLTEISVWLAREAPGNTSVTGAPGFYTLPLMYFVVEPWLEGSGQPATIPPIGGAPAIPLFDHTGRYYLLEAMTKLSKSDLATWGGTVPLFVLPKIIAADPNLETRIKAMELLGKVDLPATLYGPLLGALDKLRDNLGALPGPQALKVIAVSQLVSLRDRVVSQQAEAAYAIQSAGVEAQAAAAMAAAGEGGAAAAMAAARGSVPTLPPPFDWKPWATLGVTVGLVGGVLLMLRRRGASPAPAALPMGAALPPSRQELPRKSVVLLPGGRRYLVKSVAEAARMVEQDRDAGNYGGTAWYGKGSGKVQPGDVLGPDGERLAHVSYNGRTWQADRKSPLEGVRLKKKVRSSAARLAR